MKETEIKVLDVNKTEILKKIKSINAKKIWSGVVVEKYFSSPSLKKQKKTLRLRKIYGTVELAMKYGKQNSFYAIREELQVTISDFKVGEMILLELGFKCVMHREKKRESYDYKGVKLEIDEYPEFPVYLEIEGTKKQIDDVMLLFGFNKSSTSNLSATSLFKKEGLDHRNMLFKKN